MQTYTIEIADEFVPEFMAMLNKMPKKSIQLKSSKVEQNDVKQVENKLSKLEPHPNCVNGDIDDFVHISWEYEVDSVLAMEDK